jgi:hypothetical protein
VGLIAGLDTEDRGKILLTLARIEHGSPGRPVRCQTLYADSHADVMTSRSRLLGNYEPRKHLEWRLCGSAVSE